MARRLPEVRLDPGVVYRTSWLRLWGENPTRLAQKLEARDLVRRLGHGLLYVPRTSRFGDAPPRTLPCSTRSWTARPTS